MNTDDPELLLPAEILAKATRTGNECAWRRDDLASVFSAAESVGLANLGGQVQFRLPDGTCELYWQRFESGPVYDGEAWTAYVARSRREVEHSLMRLPTPAELVADGLAHFDFLRDKAADGTDVEGAMCFVCYFASK